METFSNLNDFFDEALRNLSCNADTRAYIVSVFTKFRTAQFDLSKDNITLTFAQAHFKQDFFTYQNLGDWIFFSKILHPGHLVRASEDYYHNIGRLSYYSCYKLIDRKWKLFEELSDNFVVLKKETQMLLTCQVKTLKI